MPRVGGASLKPILKTPKEWLKTMICGVCMGATDIIPGISGGTMCFIMGIYDDLLRSISSFNLNALGLLFKLQFRQFFNSVGWEFLLALLTGISFSFIMLASFFHFLLGHEVYRVYLYALFSGLILASIFFCGRQVRHWNFKACLGLTLGALIAFVITGIRYTPELRQPLYDVPVDIHLWKTPLPSKIANYNYDQHMLLNVDHTALSAMMQKGYLTPETNVYSQSLKETAPAQVFANTNYHASINWWITLCGMIAITAMLLPGISGSYMLTILGVYPIVIGALADFVAGAKHGTFYTEEFFILASMMIGIVTGALIFSRVVHWLMQNYHNTTVATMIGFMVGALRAVWPFRAYEYVVNPLKVEKGPLLVAGEPIWPALDNPILYKAMLFACLGFGLVLMIEWIAHRKVSH